jgi:hypothetical protein
VTNTTHAKERNEAPLITKVPIGLKPWPFDGIESLPPAKKQVGGKHYVDLVIQPVEYAHKNKLGFCEGNVVKYVTRWKDKGGIADLEKAKHYIELLIAMEQETEDNDADIR